MTEDTIIGKVFDKRTIDRVTLMDNNLIEIGFADNTFERVHENDFADFCAVLGVEAVVVTDEILEENPVLADAGVEIGSIGYGTNDVPEGAMIDETTAIEEDVPTDEILEETPEVE